MSVTGPPVNVTREIITQVWKKKEKQFCIDGSQDEEVKRSLVVRSSYFLVYGHSTTEWFFLSSRNEVSFLTGPPVNPQGSDSFQPPRTPPITPTSVSVG